MTLSAALDSGLAFAVVIIFFVLIYPGFMEGFKWWGTEIYKQVRFPKAKDFDFGGEEGVIQEKGRPSC